MPKRCSLGIGSVAASMLPGAAVVSSCVTPAPRARSAGDDHPARGLQYGRGSSVVKDFWIRDRNISYDSNSKG